MWLSKAAHDLNRVIKLISIGINSIAAAVLTVMMFLTASDVFLRYLFDRPITGALEITEYLMVVVVAFGLAYCALLKGHVRVEVITSRFSQRAQAIINSITGLIALVLFSLITRQCIVYIGVMYDSEITSSVLLIPTYPFVIVLTVGSLMFCLALLVDFLEFLTEAVKK